MGCIWFTIQLCGRAKRGASGALNLQSAQQGRIPRGGYEVRTPGILFLVLRVGFLRGRVP